MMKITGKQSKKTIILLIVMMVANVQELLAQCAMCKTTIENNVSAGEVTLASKLNIGIMYLLFAPYIMAVLIGYFWYKNSKANAKKIKISSHRRL